MMHWDFASALTAWLQANAWHIALLAIVLVACALVTHVASRVAREALERSRVPSVSIFINLLRVVLWSCAAAIILQNVFGIDPSTIMTALGVGGLALSLGLKDTIANVVSGFGLMMGKVIHPGDIISIAGVTGTVKDITWRQTVVQEANGNQLIIPNAVLNTSSLERVTRRNHASVTIPFTTPLTDDLHALEARIEQALDEPKLRALFATPPLISFQGFSQLGVRGSLNVPLVNMSSSVDATNAIMHALADAGIIAASKQRAQAYASTLQGDDFSQDL